MMNNILWNDLSIENSREIYNYDINYQPDYPKTRNDGKVYVNYSDVRGSWQGEGNIDSAPIFADSVNYYLSEDSPCIDAGHDSSIFI